MARRGRKPGSRKTGGRKRGTPNRITIKMGGTFAETAKEFDGEALATLVEVMRDKAASPSARVRAAELVLDRAHGKAAPALPALVPRSELAQLVALAQEHERRRNVRPDRVGAEVEDVEAIPPQPVAQIADSPEHTINGMWKPR